MDRIDRKKVVKRHNPVLTAIDYESPLTVGNGFFAYTFDVTGMQQKGGLCGGKKEGNEEVYEWLRHNPHRYNLVEAGLLYDGREVEPGTVGGIRQELNLYEGIARSEFLLGGEACSVLTACGDEDSVAFSLHSRALQDGK